MSDETYSIKDIANWSDDVCIEKGKELEFRVIDIRTILRYALKTDETLNNLKEVLKMGRRIQYAIECPNCHVKYRSYPEHIKHKSKVICQDCGHEYLQCENIFGITVDDICVSFN